MKLFIKQYQISYFINNFACWLAPLLHRSGQHHYRRAINSCDYRVFGGSGSFGFYQEAVGISERT
jgi:hypothetical protein